jgi:Barstar (barnase inhibitor)
MSDDGRSHEITPSGLFLAPRNVAALRENAARAGMAWFEINLARVETKKAFLAACAKALRFPELFGGNWDAFADLLKDLYADCVISCRGCEQFASTAPDDYAVAIEIFRDAATYWKERTSKFLVLVDAKPTGLELPRLPRL